MLEEAAYCDIQVINEVVVPLLSMTDSVLLCISTLLESTNHYTKMFSLTDSNGRKLFESMQITLVCGKLRLLSPASAASMTAKDYEHPLFLLVCVCRLTDACMRTEHPERCTHKLAEMPRWLSSQKLEIIKALLADDPALLCATTRTGPSHPQTYHPIPMFRTLLTDSA